MDFIIPLLYFLFTNALFVFVSKKGFGKCFPLTIFISAFSYFFSQILFGTFKIGFIVNLLLPIIFIILFILKKNDKERVNSFKNNYFNSGFYIFLTIYLLVFIFDLNRGYSVWDEFSHWGVMIKEILRLDKFYSSDLSTLMVHKDYPPIIQLYEAFYVKLSGGYLESTVYKGFRLLEFSLLLPFLETLKVNKKENIIRTVLTVLITYLVLLLFDGHNIINSIYLDYLMAILVAYILSLIIIEKEPLSYFNLINLSITMSFLLLTKQIAFTLYLMTIFLFIIMYFIKRKEISKQKISKYVLSIILLVIIPLTFWKGWNNYVSNLNVDKQFVLSDLKVNELKCILNSTCGETWQIDAANNYYKALKTKEITTSHLLSLSYPQCIFLTILLLYLLWLYGKEYIKKKEILYLLLTLIIGYIGYAFVMLIMYVFSFGPIEGPNLASYERYMSTYVIITLVTIIMLFSYINSQKEKNNKLLILLSLVLILIQSPLHFEKIIPKVIYTKNGYVKVNEFDRHANNIKEYLEPNSKLFIVSQNTTGEYQFYIKYYLDGINVNKDYYSFNTENGLDYKSYYINDILPELKKYDYLYLAVIDDNFIEKYSFMFNGKVKKEGLYKIDYNQKLTLIN